MIYIFQIDGNIGAGKSTIIKTLKNILSIIGINKIPIIYLSEPISIWENIKDSYGENIIEKYYANQERYAFTFQIMAFLTRINQIKEIHKKNNNAIIICERSIITDKKIFAKMLYDNKKMEEIEYSIYLKWFDEFAKQISIKGIIYIKTDPEICYERIKKRNRKGENISLLYLKNVHNYHENWLQNTKKPVLTIDGNINFLDNFPNNWKNMIEMFLINLYPYISKTPSFQEYINNHIYS